MSKDGRLVLGDDGRWIYLTHDELVEASDRRWSELTKPSDADTRLAAEAELWASGVAGRLGIYVRDMRKRASRR